MSEALEMSSSSANMTGEVERSSPQKAGSLQDMLEQALEIEEAPQSSPRSFSARKNSFNDLIVSFIDIDDERKGHSHLNYNKQTFMGEGESGFDFEKLDQEVKMNQIKLELQIRKSSEMNQKSSLNNPSISNSNEVHIGGIGVTGKVWKEDQPDADLGDRSRQSRASQQDNNMMRIKKLKQFSRERESNAKVEQKFQSAKANPIESANIGQSFSGALRSQRSINSDLWNRRAMSDKPGVQVSSGNNEHQGKVRRVAELKVESAERLQVKAPEYAEQASKPQPINPFYDDPAKLYPMYAPPEKDARALERSKPFEFTKPSRDELKFKRLRCISKLLLLLYLILISIFAWQVQREDSVFSGLQYPKYVSYALFVLAFNILVIFPLFTVAIRAAVFPFSLWISRDILVGMNCIGYSQDFATLIERSYVLMVTKGFQNMIESSDHPQSQYSKELRKKYGESLQDYDAEDCNIKFSTMYALVGLYSVTNLQVIQRMKQEKKISSQIMSRKFNEISAVLEVMASIFTKLECSVTNFAGYQFDVQFGEYYKDDHTGYSDRCMPVIKDTDINRELLALFETCAQKFRDIVRRSNAPINFGCCRCNCFGLFFFNVFHSHDQMEQMLQNYHDGRRFVVRATDGTRLDCMFFPHNDEKVLTMDEIQNNLITANDEEKGLKGQYPEYLNYPTLIFFNMNAQCYQQQVHSPNAFWLKFYATNQINVMAWNYRNYGRSEGMPDPYTCYHDAESILKFLINTIGVRGRIGCFGRSIGGTIATHMANRYPQHIDFLFVDRSLGNLESVSSSIISGTQNANLFKCFTYGGWNVRSDINFLEAKCFKMLSQDPWDETINQYVALNSQVAREACKENIGEDRYHSLKLLKTYNALRLFSRIETKLFVACQKHLKNQKKIMQQKRKVQRQIVKDQYYDSNGYDEQQLQDIEIHLRGVSEKENKSDKSGGYSTDVDTFSRTKMLLAQERKWIQIVQGNEIDDHRLDIIIHAAMKDNFKPYEAFSSVLEKAMVFINDLHGGVMRLGWIINANNLYKPEHLMLFVDNLFTYGSDYIDQPKFVTTTLKHRDQRLKSIKAVAEIIKTLHAGKEEIKNTQCKRPNDSLRWLIIACLSMLIKFFENLKKQLKKSEIAINFGPRQVGHLIPLSTGHRNKPTDPEINYIHHVIKLSEFQYNPDEFASISPIPLNFGGYASSVLPSIQPSPNVIFKGSVTGEAAADLNPQQVDAIIKLVKNENSFIDNDPLSDILSRPLTDDDRLTHKDKIQKLEKKVNVIKKKFKLTLHATSINHEQLEKLRKERQQKLEQLQAAAKNSQRKTFSTRVKSVKSVKSYASDQSDRDVSMYGAEGKRPLTVKVPKMTKAGTMTKIQMAQLKKLLTSGKGKKQDQEAKRATGTFKGRLSQPTAIEKDIEVAKRGGATFIQKSRKFLSAGQGRKARNRNKKESPQISPMNTERNPRKEPMAFSERQSDQPFDQHLEYQSEGVLSSNSNQSASSYDPNEGERCSKYSKSHRNTIASMKSKTDEGNNSQVLSFYQQLKEASRSRKSKIREENAPQAVKVWSVKAHAQRDEVLSPVFNEQNISVDSRRASSFKRRTERPTPYSLTSSLSQPKSRWSPERHSLSPGPFQPTTAQRRFGSRLQGPDDGEIEVDEITSEESISNRDRKEAPRYQFQSEDWRRPPNGASPIHQDLAQRLEQDVHSQFHLNPIRVAGRNEGAALADEDLPASILSNDMVNSRASRQLGAEEMRSDEVVSPIAVASDEVSRE